MSSRVYAIVAGASLAVFLAASAVYVVKNRNASEDLLAGCRAGQVGGGEIGGPFTLVNKAGETVTDADVIKRPTLVYFGYTFCPDVCPLDMARNAEALDLIKAQGQEVDLLFITVDPVRDTPEVAGEFAEAIHPAAIGLSGSNEQVAAAAKAYKVYYRLQNSEDKDYYLVDHSAFTYLMLPGMGFADFYRREATAEEIAKSASCMISAAG